jgi:ankyrin repeat protein
MFWTKRSRKKQSRKKKRGGYLSMNKTKSSNKNKTQSKKNQTEIKEAIHLLKQANDKFKQADDKLSKIYDSNGFEDLVHFRDKNYRTISHHIAMSGNVDMLYKWAQMGINEEEAMKPDKNGQDEYFLSIIYGHPECAKSILDWTYESTMNSLVDKKGRTPLHYAAFYGYYDLVAKMMNEMMNIINNQKDIWSLNDELKMGKKNILHKDKNGKTVFDYAKNPNIKSLIEKTLKNIELRIKY